MASRPSSGGEVSSCERGWEAHKHTPPPHLRRRRERGRALARATITASSPDPIDRQHDGREDHPRDHPGKVNPETGTAGHLKGDPRSTDGDEQPERHKQEVAGRHGTGAAAPAASPDVGGFNRGSVRRVLCRTFITSMNSRNRIWGARLRSCRYRHSTKTWRTRSISALKPERSLMPSVAGDLEIS